MEISVAFLLIQLPSVWFLSSIFRMIHVLNYHCVPRVGLVRQTSKPNRQIKPLHFNNANRNHLNSSSLRRFRTTILLLRVLGLVRKVVHKVSLLALDSQVCHMELRLAGIHHPGKASHHIHNSCHLKCQRDIQANSVSKPRRVSSLNRHNNLNRRSNNRHSLPRPLPRRLVNRSPSPSNSPRKREQLQ